MITKRHVTLRRLYAPAALLLLITLAFNTYGAEHHSDKPVQEPVPGSLTIGRGTSGNVLPKALPDPTDGEYSEAASKLGKIRELRGTTNQWEEVARLLQEVRNSKVGEKMQMDVKRLASLELAGYAESNGQPTLAIQYLAEYIERYPDDEIIPEILLRQAYLFRTIGAYDMAISKLYLVMNASLNIKTENLNYFKRVSLTAQTEIAETYFLNKRYKDAAQMYARLLNEPDEELNIVVVRAKLIRSLARDADDTAVVREARQFLKDHATSEYQAEVRYLLALSHKQLGEKQEALRELLLLLEAVEVAPPEVAGRWKTWKMAAGNEIGNQLFLEGDFIHAVQVYKGLLNLEEAAEWRLPLEYQIGLCFEKLEQPLEAIQAYSSIVEHGKSDAETLPYNLRMVISMAKFRHAILSWAQSMEEANRAIPSTGQRASK